MNVAVCPEHAPLNLISLCTGGGGLDRAVELAIPGARPILCVERESFAVASLVAQIENGLMAPAAVWSDVRTFPGRRFRGRVDGLIGGIPCQPHSLAGRRGGSTDERDLWAPRSARRIIAQARPWLVLIENVGGFLSAGADEIPGAARVLRDLRKLGYTCTLVVVRADQMGLPHERLRVFILGIADWFMADAGRLSDQRRGEPRDVLRAPGAPEGDGEQRKRGGSPADGRVGCLADADGDRSQGGESAHTPTSERRRLGDIGHPLADRNCERRGSDKSEQARGQQSIIAECGDDMANGLGARLEGCGSQGDRPGECAASERGGEHLGDANGSTQQRRRRELSSSEGPQARRGDHGPRSADNDVADANVVELRRQSPAREQPLVQQDDGAGGGVELVDAVGGGRDRRPQGALGEPGGRSADERSGARPFLRPPGPGDVDAWRHVALVAPGLLPAVSRYDRLRLEMGVQGIVAAGDPPAGRAGRSQARKARRGAGQGASAWVDARTGECLGTADVQAAVERAVRGVADVMAPRIDELRMLGNGVADAQGALAVRIGVHDLAARGSAGAALLVRMMGEA